MSNRLTAVELIHLLSKIDPSTEIHWHDYDYDTDGYFQIYPRALRKTGCFCTATWSISRTKAKMKTISLISLGIVGGYWGRRLFWRFMAYWWAQMH